MAENVKCVKKLKKQQQQQQRNKINFVRSYLTIRDWLARFVSNFVCGFAYIGGISAAKFS